MRKKKLFSSIIFIIFIPVFIHGQENKTWNKLEFKKGVPAELVEIYKSFKGDNHSHFSIPIDSIKEKIYLLSRQLPDKSFNFYLVSSNDPDNIVRIETRLFEPYIKTYEFDDAGEYRFFLELKREGDDILYSLYKRNKKLYDKYGKLKPYDNTPESRFIFEIAIGGYGRQNSSFFYNPRTNATYELAEPQYSYTGFYGGALSYSLRFFLAKNTKFELRGGIYSSGYGFPVGLCFGAFLRNKIIDGFFAGAGVHINISGQWKSDSNSKGLTSGDSYTCPLVFVGYELSKGTSLLISFFPLNEELIIYDETKRFSPYPPNPSITNTREIRKLFWGARLGVDFSL